MHLHRVQIGGFEIKNNVWLAPLAGYTNYPFRKIALESGAGFVFTEMEMHETGECLEEYVERKQSE